MWEEVAPGVEVGREAGVGDEADDGGEVRRRELLRHECLGR